MKITEIEALQRRAEKIVESDPELRLLRAKFVTFGCTEPESLGAVLGRAFSRLKDSSASAAHA
jgi:hypothetical protein